MKARKNVSPIGRLLYFAASSALESSWQYSCMSEYVSRIHMENCKIPYLFDTLQYTVWSTHHPRCWRQIDEDMTQALKATSIQTTEN